MKRDAPSPSFNSNHVLLSDDRVSSPEGVGREAAFDAPEAQVEWLTVMGDAVKDGGFALAAIDAGGNHHADFVDQAGVKKTAVDVSAADNGDS